MKLESWNPWKHNKIVREQNREWKKSLDEKAESATGASQIISEFQTYFKEDISNFLKKIEEEIEKYPKEYTWDQMVEKFVDLNISLKEFLDKSRQKLQEKQNEAYEMIDLTDQETKPAQDFGLMMVNSLVQIVLLSINSQNKKIYEKFLIFILKYPPDTPERHEKIGQVKKQIEEEFSGKF